MKENMRSFWFRKRKEVEYGTGNCGLPPRKPIIEPCRDCPSKCLETGYGEPIKKQKKGLFASKSKEPVVIKEKPSNCAEIKPVEEKLTWWETIFGPDPRRSWPDPCTCRLAHRQRKMCRSQDPKLKDPRYKETAGDVFLYTEVMKTRTSSCHEPQPKPPPPYKIPKEVLYKSMCAGDLAVLCEISEKDEDAFPITRPFRIPFEEMRPPEKKRKVFSCQRGIRTEDIVRPTRKDSHIYLIRPTVSIPNSSIPDDTKKNVPVDGETKDKSESNEAIQRRSKIEQLKFLIQQRDTLHCMRTTP